MCKIVTTPEFIKMASQKHQHKYSYDETVYISSRHNIIVTCPVHGNFSIKANNHLNGAGCAKCAKNCKVTTEDFIRRANEVHGDTYDYSISIYKSMKTKLDIICKHHGIIQITPDSHLRGGGCRKCADDANSCNYLLSQETFIERCTILHNNRYNYSNTVYLGMRNKIIIICPIHGEFTQLAVSHAKGNGCKHCAESSALYSDLPTLLYAVKITHPSGIVKYKIGITTKTVETRFIEELRKGYIIECTDSHMFPTGRDAFLCEQFILTHHKDRYRKVYADSFLCNSCGDTELLNSGLTSPLQEIIRNLPYINH